MTNQQRALGTIVQLTRALVPPQLDFVVIVFEPEGEMVISSAMMPSKKQSVRQQIDRARQACKAFIDTPPRPQVLADGN